MVTTTGIMTTTEQERGALVSLDDEIQVEQVGSKAWRLAEIRQLGCRVPPGFVIPDSAFRMQLKAAGLWSEISTQVNKLDDGSVSETAQLATKIEKMLASCHLSAPFEAALRASSESLLAGGPVVVRSSALGEDSKTAAFAGQLDSFLNVNTHEELLRAVKRCWASFWSHRSLGYQRARGVSLNGMGVLVQEQVRAQVSGVLFTRHPHYPERGTMVLEYALGLAHDLVSGKLTPRQLILSPNGEVISDSAETGPHEAEDAQEQQKIPILEPTLLRQLTRWGQRLESHFGHPQDIEWVADHDLQVHLVQSRPVTTHTEREKPVVHWSNANVNENYPDPVCPLLYSIATTGYYHYFRNLGIAFGIAPKRIREMEPALRGIIGTQAGRIYYNLTHVHAVLYAAPFGGFLANSFNQFVGAEDSVSPTIPRRKTLLSRWERLKEGLSIGTRPIQCFLSLDDRIQRFERIVDKFASDSHPDRLTRLNGQELLALWQQFVKIRSEWTNPSLADAASMISYGLTRRFLAAAFDDENRQLVVHRLLTGLCNLVSGLPTEHLWQLSRQIRKNSQLRNLFAQHDSLEAWQQIQSDASYRTEKDEITRFLENWGYRCSGELMLTQANYQENPPALLDLLRPFVNQSGESPRDLLERQATQRLSETQDVMNALSQQPLHRFLPWPRKNWIAGHLIHWTQQSVAFRERARDKQALLYSRCRQLALASDTLLRQKNLLHKAGDIFYLTHPEITDLLSGTMMMPTALKEIAALRRTTHSDLDKLRPPDKIQLPPGEYWSPQEAHEGHPMNGRETLSRVATTDMRTMSGQGVSSGVFEGTAVVLLDPTQYKDVSEGDILVTRQTDPGWGPILFLVKGLVMERGGMLSHGAILAREFGIPTVVDVREATQQITTGDRLQIDGDRGIVKILSH